jgi:hypothetical protein
MATYSQANARLLGFDCGCGGVKVRGVRLSDSPESHDIHAQFYISVQAHTASGYRIIAPFKGTGQVQILGVRYGRENAHERVDCRGICSMGEHKPQVRVWNLRKDGTSALDWGYPR